MKFPTNPINALEARLTRNGAGWLRRSCFQQIQLTHWKRVEHRRCPSAHAHRFQQIQLTHWKRDDEDDLELTSEAEGFQQIQLTHWKRGSNMITFQKVLKGQFPTNPINALEASRQLGPSS